MIGVGAVGGVGRRTSTTIAISTSTKLAISQRCEYCSQRNFFSLARPYASLTFRHALAFTSLKLTSGCTRGTNTRVAYQRLTNQHTTGVKNSSKMSTPHGTAITSARIVLN